MDSGAILEIVLKARDEASKTIEGLGKSVDEASKKTASMATAFKAAGGIVLGAGLAGVGALKMFADAAAEHQVAMASVDATLKNVSSSIGTYTTVVGGSTTSSKEAKKAIQAQIQALELQKSQLTLNNAEETKSVTVTTGHGKTLKEHTKIVHENAASITEQKNAIDQQIISLKESEQGIAKSGTTTGGVTKIVDNASMSYDNLKKTADSLSDSYLRLGFLDHDTALAFAQDVRVTGNVTDAQTMLAASADLARLKNVDLSTATSSLTMAYAGNTRALKTLGIEAPKGAKGMETVALVQQAAAGQAEAYTKTWDGAMQVLSVTFEKFKVAIGDRLLPTMTKFVDSIVHVIQWLNNLSPQTYDTITKVLLFGTAFSLIAGPVLLFIGFLPALFAGFGTLFTTILPVVAILAAVGGAAYYVYTHWDQLEKKFPSLNSVLKTVQSFLSGVATTARMLFDFFTGGDPTIKTSEKNFAGLARALNILRDAFPAILSGFIGIGTTLLVIAAPAIWAAVTAFGALIGEMLWLAGTVIIVFAPWVLLAAAIGGAAYLIITHWQQLVTFFSTAKTNIGAFFSSLGNTVSSFFSGVFTEAIQIGETVWSAFVSWFNQQIFPFKIAFILLNDFVVIGMAGIKLALTMFSQWFSATFGPSIHTGLTTIAGIWKTVTTDISGFWTWVMTGIRNIWQATWSAISSFFTPIITAINSTMTSNMTSANKSMQSILTSISKFWQTTWNGMVDFLGSIGNDIRNIIKTVLNDVIGFFDNVINGANSVGSKVPGYIKIPDIPKFQDGGYVPQTGLAIVHQGEFVMSNAMLAGRQGVPSSVSNTTNNNSPINIYATVSNEVDVNLLGNKLAFAIRNSR